MVGHDKTQCQKIVRFSGRVQGVGFRYITYRLAQRYDVTGYVKNLPDGRVECVVEGTNAEIDAFLKEVSNEMQRYIRETTQQSAPFSGQFRGFNIGY
jgi:acylphosphatase